MATIQIIKDRKQTEVEMAVGANLLQAIQETDISISSPCGGRGKCGKCKVLASGALSTVSEREQRWLTEEEINQNIRLACYATILGDCTVKLIDRNVDAVIEKEYFLWQGDLAPIYGDNSFGAAFDIGTTTVAAQLFSSKDKKPVALLGEINRQQIYGSDVISRIVYCNEHTVLPLSQLIRLQLSEMLVELCKQVALDTNELSQIVVTGNTTMLYILFGIDPAPLSIAPFTMEYSFGGVFDAKLPDFPDLPCYVPGCASAYVGADITCSVLASEITEKAGNILLVDAGTNGEMVLSFDKKLICCSTAAGPAFEGAGIACGGTASLGAIDFVKYSDGKFTYTTIGDAPADKLCGSGLIDAIAAMLQAGLITPKGKLLAEEGIFYIGDSQVFISKKDVRQLQLAKAAIRAGMDTLIHESGLDYDSIDQIILCGGFGSYLNPFSAETIGLIPPGFAEKSTAIGNAAGNGAGQILQSVHKLDAATAIVQRMETVELASNPYFRDRYIESMSF